jgi:hypothetical protein
MPIENKLFDNVRTGAQICTAKWGTLSPPGLPFPISSFWGLFALESTRGSGERREFSEGVWNRAPITNNYGAFWTQVFELK